MSQEKYKSGYVSLIGRPNVGKSTLLNAILGEKVAIVTPKPQTTRNRITGIKTLPDAQIIFVDTPGIHKPQQKLGESMNRLAYESLEEMDIVLFMVEPQMPGSGDLFVLDKIKRNDKPVFLLINKIDTVKKTEVLPVIDAYSRLYPFKEIIPLSALKTSGLDELIGTVLKYLPEGPKLYPDDIVTDQMERFMVSEIIREKIIEETREEVPHASAVEVISWEEREDGVVFIQANIYIERDGQKGIIIGKHGSRLKAIGTGARHDIENLLGTRVFLELWVKIKKDWRSDERFLRELGFR
ncbi:MAG TPA: GTPase Era [Dissulfurispiraceae bacterium]|nr:GTPase Era [Dissulfurispiraceae bacterium]